MKSLLRISRTRHWHMGLGATLLVLTAAVAALGYWYFVVPTRFTVAVGPPGSVEARVVRAFAQTLNDRGGDVRLRVVDFDDVRQSGEALQNRLVQLALVRPDVFLPANELTLAILREQAVLVLGRVASDSRQFEILLDLG